MSAREREVAVVTGGKATQYQLLGLLILQGGSLQSASNGWLAGHLDWVSFFVATTAFALPGFLMLVWVMRLAREDPGQIKAVGEKVHEIGMPRLSLSHVMARSSGKG